MTEMVVTFGYSFNRFMTIFLINLRFDTLDIDFFIRHGWLHFWELTNLNFKVIVF